MAIDPVDASSVLTAICDWSGASDPPTDPDPQPYLDLLPPVRAALDWLSWEQPEGASWPKDGIVYPTPAGPDVTIRVCIGDGPSYAPAYRCSIIFERRGDGRMVHRITSEVADRLRATVRAAIGVVDDRGAIFLPGATFTWWAFLPAMAPSASLADAHRRNQTEPLLRIDNEGYLERVGLLNLPSGWAPDRGPEYH